MGQESCHTEAPGGCTAGIACRTTLTVMALIVTSGNPLVHCAVQLLYKSSAGTDFWASQCHGTSCSKPLYQCPLYVFHTAAMLFYVWQLEDNGNTW